MPGAPREEVWAKGERLRLLLLWALRIEDGHCLDLGLVFLAGKVLTLGDG